jgi:hypothetical protein
MLSWTPRVNTSSRFSIPDAKAGPERSCLTFEYYVRLLLLKLLATSL